MIMILMVHQTYTYVNRFLARKYEPVFEVKENRALLGNT
jgi:hypothetical protein